MSDTDKAPENYRKAYENYQKLVTASIAGDEKARVEKGKAFQEVRAIERESAKQGVVLTGGKVIGKGIPTKRSLQEEYVRKFDEEKKVEVKEDEPPVTLREHHSKRLLGK